MKRGVLHGTLVAASSIGQVILVSSALTREFPVPSLPRMAQSTDFSHVVTC